MRIPATPLTPLFNRCIYLLPLLFLSTGISAQSISGICADGKSNQPLYGAKVLLSSTTDSTFRTGSYTDEHGVFHFSDLDPSDYTLHFTLLGYGEVELKADLVSSTSIDLGVVKMKMLQQIDEVKVSNQMIRVEQNGDTTAYNAEAFKTNPDASIEDLVTKMPGITVENGVVKAHGEEVKKVLIDGEEFFGDDAMAALKNLPAEIVSKIQVYDKMSDQAAFTGVSDGEDVKALNIVTKPGMNSGQFGKLYAGYGTDDRYISGGMLNFFNGSRRLSFIGLSNNVNQQNFSSDDILGVLGSESGSSSGGRRGRGGMSGSENFIVGQQNGISQTHAFGINYSDKWGEKTKISGSYFFNNARNTARSITDRTYILSDSEGQRYQEDAGSESTNFNHRANLKIQHDINASNSLTLTPRLSIQRNRSASNTLASNTTTDNKLINSLVNDKATGASGYTIGADLLYRHRFSKKGRSFSINMNGSYQLNNRDTKQYSLNGYYDEEGDSNSLINQFSDNLSNGYRLSSKINYTEPLGESSSLQFNYSPGYSFGNSNKTTNQYDSEVDAYRVLDTLLSNRFENTTATQRAGIGYRYKKGKGHFNLEINYDYSQLINVEHFPLETNRQIDFQALLPTASFKYDFSKTRSLRIQYRTGTRIPSINQLQTVVDNSNPLSLSSGNDALRQQYDHRMVLRFSTTNAQRASSFFFFVFGEYNSNYIGNGTIIAPTDTTLTDGTILSQGAQFSQPVNLEGSWNWRSFASYGIPVHFLKSNVNLNVGANYSINPGLINGRINKSTTTNVNSGLTLASNISEKIDFTFSYSVNYTVVSNSTQGQSASAYMVQNGSLRFNWIPVNRVVVNTVLAANAYSGLSSSFNQHIFLWNAGLGYKFLKEQQLESRISVYDLLNQNTSIARNVTESYIEDVETQVLQRYFMVTLIYQLKQFGGKEANAIK